MNSHISSTTFAQAPDGTFEETPLDDSHTIERKLSIQAKENELRIPRAPGEYWWGGAIEDGFAMPAFDPIGTGRDLTHPGYDRHGLGLPSNQASPILLSTTGRVVQSRYPFRFEFNQDELHVSGRELILAQAEPQTLRGAFLAAAENYFPPSGETPSLEMFTKPQFNTWIESPYKPTQEGVLRYARTQAEAGLNPGVIIIDDNWATDYGNWEFDLHRFPDPAGMIKELHDMGCRVMLWVVPFVSPDSPAFRYLAKHGMVLLDADSRPAIREWWNGFSATLDLSNPEALAWMKEKLDALRAIGIDGFKFDAGDVRDYRLEDKSKGCFEPVDFCESWAGLGAKYPFNEMRACWRMGGQPLGQRLQDKPPTWHELGILSLIPQMLAQGLQGHPYTCPDMIGGGEIEAMTALEGIDQEFFVRYAQVAALSPMMQFSASPVRVLDEKHLAAVRKALEIREHYLPQLRALIKHASQTGEPIVRPLAYHGGDPQVIDQFFFGKNLIVAPVLAKGASERKVQLPAGAWRDDLGEIHQGPATITTPTPLDRIPRFERA